ncbi:hypothetical protein GCM10027589_53810 [Actinocorallia lasiicapitis]
MEHRRTRLAVAGTLAAVLAAGTATAAAARPTPTPTPTAAAATPKKPAPPKRPAPPRRPLRKKMPAGTTTATSFWDAQTASGRPMRFATVASPYWPLGTRVKITYRKKSATGIVDDFGPAEWAVAQHHPPALVDLSEPMMRRFTGFRSNKVKVRFKVLRWGKGRSYRTSGTGYKTAMGDYARTPGR